MTADDSAKESDETPRQDTLVGDPRDTDHPTGEKQARKNTEDEPPA